MTIEEYLGTVKFDKYGGQLLAVNGKNQHLIADIRGWGGIQYLFKTQSEAEAFQDQVGQFIADAVNEKLQRGKKCVNGSWIYVGYILPERGKAVLVHTKAGVTTVAYLCVGKRAWQVFGEIGSDIDEDDEIHYWMPLPSAPINKGGDQ